jgi:IMP cyclohydrolase
MAYHGRVVLVGNYEGNPLGGFVLASRSDHERRIVPYKNRANIIPSESAMPMVMEELGKGRLKILDNCYSCLFGFEDRYNNGAIVSFNGRFGNIAERVMKRGNAPETAIKTALEASNPHPNDPRLVAFVHIIDGKPEFFFGSYDVDSKLYVVRGVTVGHNQAKYLAITSHDQAQEIELDCPSLDELAEHIYYAVLGEKPEHGIGAAACLFDRDEFKLNIFNQEDMPEKG